MTRYVAMNYFLYYFENFFDITIIYSVSIQYYILGQSVCSRSVFGNVMKIRVVWIFTGRWKLRTVRRVNNSVSRKPKSIRRV